MGRRDEELDLPNQAARKISEMEGVTAPMAWAVAASDLLGVVATKSNMDVLMVCFREAQQEALQENLRKVATLPAGWQAIAPPQYSRSERERIWLEAGRLDGMALMMRIIDGVNYEQMANELESMAKRIRGEGSDATEQLMKLTGRRLAEEARED